MLGYLLNVVYLAALAIAAPWLLWRRLRKGSYGPGAWAEKLLGRLPRRTSSGPCIWLHAVSLGEINALAPLVAELARRRSDVELVITTTTATGIAQARQRYAGRHVSFCPLDFTWAVKAALRRVRPSLLVLAEVELWPNLLMLARRGGAAVAVVNGRISDRSLRGYRRVGPLVRRLLARLDFIAAQSPTDAERFVALGAAAERVVAAGSLKFDGARADRHDPTIGALRRLAGIAADEIVLLAGSTQAPEEAYALAAFRRWRAEYPRLRLVLVPRHPERFDEVARLLASSGLPFVRRSALAAGAGSPPAAAAPPVVLVDRMGELAAWWGLAHIGFVGGSFGPREGQNMIEPAALGVATCFGPRTKNFRDVVAALLAAPAAVVVASAAELERFVGRCLAEPAYAAALGHRAQAVASANRGAAARTADGLLALLPTELTAPPQLDAA